jgi:hypothetical protein
MVAAPDDPDTRDLDARIPVWSALSDLYLDTDVTLSYDYIVRALAVSPYPLESLHEMLMYDVHPALYPNLLSVAGEWAGFDETWLIGRITAVGRPPPGRRRITHWFARDIGVQWRTLAPMIQAARSAAPQP